MTSNYYSDTAYDSTQKRSLAPFDKKRKMAIGERTMRKHPLSIPARQCREYLGGSSSVAIVKEFLNTDPTKRHEYSERKLHEYLGWITTKNKAAVLSGYVTVLGYIAFFGLIIGAPLTGFALNFNITWLKTISIFIGFPFLFWIVGSYALKHGWVKDNNNVTLNRRTGMITLPWEKTMISLPFDEFDPFMTINTTSSATTIMYLRLGHRYSNKSVVEPHGFTRSWEMDAAWEQIQDFMDISKPLPDIPLYDFARENDPVSAEYDKKINRPKDFWINFDLGDLEKLHMESVNAAEKYPWGETREQAIKSGWKPSRYSTEDWRKIKKEDTTSFKKIHQEADQGNANSQYDIGKMYEEGKGVPKDYVQAYKWYAIASKKIDDGTYAITSLSDKMTSEQIEKGQTMAKNWITLYGD